MDFAFPMNLNLGAGDDTFILTAGATWIDVENPWLENFILTGSASIEFRRISFRFSSLTLAGSAKASVTDTTTFLHLGSLSISDSARLELTQNALIVDSANISDITNLIKSGQIIDRNFVQTRRPAAIRNSNGANAPLYTSFAGETNLVGNETLIRYTVLGDLNLDFTVSIADFIQLASHFNQSPATWEDGDTNFDNVVTIADFITLAGRLRTDASNPGVPEAPLSVWAMPVSKKNKHHRPKPRHQANLLEKQPHLLLLSRRLAEKR
jgi:hypothetical protein